MKHTRSATGLTATVCSPSDFAPDVQRKRRRIPGNSSVGSRRDRRRPRLLHHQRLGGARCLVGQSYRHRWLEHPGQPRTRAASSPNKRHGTGDQQSSDAPLTPLGGPPGPHLHAVFSRRQTQPGRKVALRVSRREGCRSGPTPCLPPGPLIRRRSRAGCARIFSRDSARDEPRHGLRAAWRRCGTGPQAPADVGTPAALGGGAAFRPARR